MHLWGIAEKRTRVNIREGGGQNFGILIERFFRLSPKGGFYSWVFLVFDTL